MYEKFVSLLESRHISSFAVSKATGISSSTFSEWKKGKYIPKLDKLQKIAAFFDVPVSYFLDTPSLEQESSSSGIDIDAEKQRIYSLTKDEATMEILKGLESLNSEQKSAILAVIKSFATNK